MAAVAIFKANFIVSLLGQAVGNAGRDYKCLEPRPSGNARKGTAGKALSITHATRCMLLVLPLGRTASSDRASHGRKPVVAQLLAQARLQDLAGRTDRNRLHEDYVVGNLPFGCLALVERQQ